jgi:hypothetical protein
MARENGGGGGAARGGSNCPVHDGTPMVLGVGDGTGVSDSASQSGRA